MSNHTYKIFRSSTAAALLIGLGAVPGHAQSARGSHASAATTSSTIATTETLPWRQFPLSPSARVKLDFRNAGVDAVLRVLSDASGIAIVKDPSLTGTLTLESPRQQTLSDAFSLLSAALGLRGYEIDKQDNFLIVRQKPQVSTTPKFPSGFSGFSSSGFGSSGGGRRSQPDLEVYSIKYASATALATVINDVYATTNSSTGTNTAAAALAALSASAGGFGRGQRGGTSGNSASQNVHASADDYSNSLIVNAPLAIQDQIADIIQQIDKPTDQPQQAKVFKLVYASASDLQPTIQSILSGTTPVGRSSTVTNANTRTQQNQNANRGFGGFFGRFGGGNSTSSTSTANGTVAADTRTNSLIVTSSADNLAQITQIIAKLDQPASYESTTFVYTLKNARADVVANLLNQSFGNRTTNGAVGGALSNNGLAQTTLSSTSSSSSTAPGLGTTNTRNNSSNFQVTSANGTSNETTPETTGLNALGQVVNIRNLSGQVLLVPNVDTNSIIISAPPEDKQLVEGLLDQLDQVPQQVMIETLVVEATLDKTDQLGVEFGDLLKVNPFNIPGMLAGSTNFGNTALTGGLPQGGQFTLTGRGYSAVLRAIEQDQKFNVLSTPRIFTTNNATAEINISQSIPYQSSSTVTDIGTSFSYSFLDVGIVLTVTPRITSNGKVTMDVTQTANDLVGYNSADVPIVNQREAQTTVSVLDGNTVVLGGIIQNAENTTVNKIPLLGDIPFIGNLFRNYNRARTRTELLVFLTPHVVRSDADAIQLRQNTEQELGTPTQKLIPKVSASDVGAHK